MSEDLAVSKLSQSLKQSKSRELEQVKKIEQESMSELAKSLRASLQTEVTSIEADMTKRLNKLREKMTEARQKIIADEKAMLKTLRENREEIEDESESLMQSLNKVKLKYWLVPLIVGVSLTLGLTIGTYALGKWITSQFQDLQTVRAEVTEAKKSKEAVGKYDLIVNTYKDGIELKKKPRVWQGKNGNWFVVFEQKGR